MLTLLGNASDRHITRKGFTAFPVENKKCKPEITTSKQNLFAKRFGMNKNKQKHPKYYLFLQLTTKKCH